MPLLWLLWIKIYGAQQVETDRFMKSADEIMKSRVKLVATSAANSAIVQWILAAAVAAVAASSSPRSCSAGVSASRCCRWATCWLSRRRPA
ncbi:hypothetical protein [Mycobacterium tuberculosis]|uniref:hypothetical protein n=1 Tax=Mycobacterium tuberculosis TaxID=1773 RepID=UPI00272D1721|nr:hypothetical protein [Mycobacterium tuberculosis]